LETEGSGLVTILGLPPTPHPAANFAGTLQTYHDLFYSLQQINTHTFAGTLQNFFIQISL